MHYLHILSRSLPFETRSIKNERTFLRGSSHRYPFSLFMRLPEKWQTPLGRIIAIPLSLAVGAEMAICFVQQAVPHTLLDRQSMIRMASPCASWRFWLASSPLSLPLPRSWVGRCATRGNIHQGVALHLSLRTNNATAIRFHSIKARRHNLTQN